MPSKAGQRYLGMRNQSYYTGGFCHLHFKWEGSGHYSWWWPCRRHWPPWTVAFLSWFKEHPSQDQSKGRELISAATLASEPVASHSLSFIITVILMSLDWSLLVRLVAENCGQIWLSCLTPLITVHDGHVGGIRSSWIVVRVTSSTTVHSGHVEGIGPPKLPWHK